MTSAHDYCAASRVIQHEDNRISVDTSSSALATALRVLATSPQRRPQPAAPAWQPLETVTIGSKRVLLGCWLGTEWVWGAGSLFRDEDGGPIDAIWEWHAFKPTHWAPAVEPPALCA